MIYKITLSAFPEIRRIGHLRHRNGFSEDYCHRSNILIYVLGGNFVYSLPRHTVTLTGGDHLLIPAGTPYNATVKGDCDYYFVQFRCSMVPADEQTARDYLTGSLPEKDVLYLPETGAHAEGKEDIEYRLSRCVQYARGGVLDGLYMRHGVTEVFLALSAGLDASLLHTPSPSPTLVRITRYLEENYTSQLTLTGVSEHFGFSKQYIMRLFRRRLGVTFTDYLNRLRLEKARYLLTHHHSLSVGQVAYAVGFSSIYYFDRVFKNTYRLTPREYQMKQK